MDTNVLVYAANTTAMEHQRCRALIEKARRQPGAWNLTWAICYEFLHVVTQLRVLPQPWSADAAIDFLTVLQKSPGLEILVPTDRHADVLRQVNAEVPALNGNLWHNTETAVLMREHGIRRICTRGHGLSPLPFPRGDRSADCGYLTLPICRALSTAI